MDKRILSLITITVLFCGLVFADSTAPVTTISVSQVPYTGESYITFTCNDDNFGCYRVRYGIDSGSSLNSSVIYEYTDKNEISIYDSTTYSKAGTGYSLVKTIPVTKVGNKINIPISLSYNYNNSLSYTRFNIKYIIYYTNHEPLIKTRSWNALENSTYDFFEETNLRNSSIFYDLNQVDIYIESDLPSGTAYIKDINFTYYQTDNEEKTHSFYYPTAGIHSIYYLSQDYALNYENGKYLDFNTYGSLQFLTFGQSDFTDLEGVSMNVNGIDYNAITTNWFAYDLEGITETATKTFTFTKSGYLPLIYQIDVNEFYNHPYPVLGKIGLALAPSTSGTGVPMKFYKPDQTTLYSNVYAEMIINAYNYVVGRIKTDSEGEASFNMLRTDNDFNTIMNNGEYIYEPVELEVFYPKDEKSLTNIDGNWKLRTSINYIYSDPNIPDLTNKTIYLLPNTKYPHKITVQDVAETYFERTWDLIYLGNPLSDILQPYLIDADDGTPVTFVFQDPKRDSIENVLVNIYDNINGVKTLISSGSSDVTGNALFLLLANETYELEFIYNGVTIFTTNNYTVTSNKVYWTIDLTGQDIKKIDTSYFNIRWNPITDYLPSSLTSIGYTATGKNINYTKVNFYTLNTDGTKNITYTYQKSCTTPCTVSVLLTDVNITTGNIYADANIYSDSNAIYFTYTKRWSVGTDSSINTQNLFINARRSFGCSTDILIPCPLTNIVAVVLMIILLGGIVFKFNFANPKGLLVIGLGILAVFTYLGWFWWVPLVLMVIGSIFYLRSDN